jgi:mono/diheme cytochrome c family protein
MRYAYIPVVAVTVVSVIAAYAKLAPNRALVDRGAYIANRASLCTDCHSPKLPNGQPDNKRALAGAPILFKPTVPVPKWTSEAPNLTPSGDLKNWSDKQLVRFLMTGKDPAGDLADPPMPEFRFDHPDARAVTAYLRSVPAVMSKTQRR